LAASPREIQIGRDYTVWETAFGSAARARSHMVKSRVLENEFPTHSSLTLQRFPLQLSAINETEHLLEDLRT